MKENSAIELHKYFKEEEILKIKNLCRGDTIQVKGILQWHHIGSESTILGDKYSTIWVKDQSDKIFSVTIKDFKVLDPERPNAYREVVFVLEK